MCLGVPGKIREVLQPEMGSPDRGARVDFQGNLVDVSLALIPQAAQGDWVLVHAGYAITLLNADEAAETWQWLDRAELVRELPAEVARRLGAGEVAP